MRSIYTYNYNKKFHIKQGEFSYLAFSSHLSDFDWWIELGMPEPSVVIYGDNMAICAWVFPGLFESKKARVYRVELKARIIHTARLAGYKIEDYPWLRNRNDANFSVVYEAKLISGNSYIRPLKMLRKFDEHLKIVNSIVSNIDINKKPKTRKEREKLEKTKKAISKVTSDALFDYMRYNAYSFVKANSLSALSIDYLINIGQMGNEILGKRKSESDIKAKAKAIYKWIIKNYTNRGIFYIRKYNNEKELKMAQAQNAKKLNELRKEKMKNKVLAAAAALKAENKKVTVRAVKDKAGVNIATAQKYLKELREASII